MQPSCICGQWLPLNQVVMPVGIARPVFVTSKREHTTFMWVPFCGFCCHCLLFLSPGGVFLKSFVYCEIWMLVAITWMHIFLIAQLLRNTSGNGLSVIMMVVRNAEISFLKWALHWLHCAAQCWFWPFWFFFFSLYLKLWMLELWLGTLFLYVYKNIYTFTT